MTTIFRKFISLIAGCETPDDPSDDQPLPSACEDPEYAVDHPTECNAGNLTVTGLRVNPASGTVEVKSKYPFVAYLQFSDGREKEVTDKAVWTSNSTGIAKVEKGKTTGVAEGTATIQASYRGFFDFAQLTVTAECIQVGLDIAMVFDRSGSMKETGKNGKDRLAMSKQAAQALLDNTIWTKDKIAVISFSGIVEVPYSGAPIKKPDSTVHVGLVKLKEDVSSAIESIHINDPCLVLQEGTQISRCATGIGAGLQAAYDELTSSRATNGSRKVVVLLTDGMENICNPDPVTIANTMKAAGWMIVVIALAVGDIPATDCSNVETSTYAFLQSLTTCNLFFAADTPDELADIYARIPSIVCNGNNNDPCFSYFNPPEGYAPAQLCYRDKLNYGAFSKWTVPTGAVDLIGMDLYPLFAGSPHGLFVDLVGGDPALPPGTLESRDSFVLQPGTYRLTCKLAGNQRQNLPGYKVGVRVGNVLHQVVTIDDWVQPFTTYQFNFQVHSTTNARVRFEHHDLPAGAAKTFGILLNEVELKNLDTLEVMLTDNFDSENPC